MNHYSIYNQSPGGIAYILATDWLVYWGWLGKKVSYFAKLCGEKDQSHLYLLLDSNTHNYLNYNNVYTVLYVLKSALVSLDCFCLVRTFSHYKETQVQ